MTISPILETTHPICINNNKILYYKDETTLIDPLLPSSELSDILLGNNKLLSEDSLKKWLLIHGLDKASNQYRVRGNKLLKLEPGLEYLIRIGDHEHEFLESDDYYNQLMELLNKAMSDLIVEDEIHTVVQEPGYDNLIQKDNISDYVSFDHNIQQSGTEGVLVAQIPIAYEQSDISYQHSILYDNELLLYGLYKELPKYTNLVSPGDIIEISVGYKLNKLDANNLHKILMESDPITYNGQYTYYGLTDSYTESMTLLVGDIIDPNTHESSSYKVKLNDYLELEISSNNITIYSVSDKVTEFLVKSCKLIRCNDN